ncbi:MAG TPA: carbohydrate ABC transporter permease [Spirochaetia bacterium]|nr:carbohydrate ABC transporter permease [Spirochaetia bacterium]
MNRASRKVLGPLLFYVLGLLVVVFFAFPIFWTFSLSLKDIPEIYRTPLLWFSPKPHWINYLHVLQTTQILANMENSVIIVVATLVLSLAVVLPAAYILSRRSFRGKGQLMLAMLIFQMISPIIITIPMYRLFVALHLIDNYAALVIAYAAIYSPFATWFMKGYFDTIPQAMDEAATVDGCSRLRTLWSIILPVSTPGIASVAILTAVQSWSQLILPLILLQRPGLAPISVGLLSFQSTSENITVHYLAASSILAIVPVIVLFVVLQRFIVGALTRGAVKG